jgi:hypothetical protein
MWAPANVSAEPINCERLVVREQRQALILLLIIPFGALGTYIEFRMRHHGLAGILALVTLGMVAVSIWFARKPRSSNRRQD